jgi:diguanylate cyclase (GGDEF)-like protein
MAVVHTELVEGIDRLVENAEILALHRDWEAAAGSGELPPLAAFAPEARVLVADRLMLLRPQGEGEGEAFRYLHYGREIARHAGFDMTGRTTADFQGELAQFFAGKYRQVLATRRPLYTVHQAVHAQSIISWERVILPVAEPGGAVLLLVYNRPLERKSVLFDGLLQASLDGILVLRPDFAEGGGVAGFVPTVANPRAGEILRRPVPALLGQRLPEDLFGAEGAATARLRAVHQSGAPERFTVELGGAGVARISAVRAADKVIVTLSDITEMVRASEAVEAQRAALERLAATDLLTGLPNRHATGKALAAALAAGRPVAAIAIDLDWFKEANDAEGHAAGDALLRATAERLSGCIREGDVAGRLGGDEFVALLIGLSSRETADAIAERIQAVLHQPVPYNGRLLRLGATLGLALAPEDADTPEMLMRAADEALIRAKRDGRGGIGRALPEDAARVAREAAILRALEDGTGIDALRVHLQPVVSLQQEGEAGIVALEALARWTHPALGVIEPSEFLGLAARCGRMAEVGRQVRRLALRAFATLREAGLPAPRLALNLSVAEVMRGDIGTMIAEDLAGVGLAFGAIDLEITEELLLERVSRQTLDQLAALRGRGARLALDDFGTGRSGLAQLLRLPLDSVKLDRTFVVGLGRDPRAAEIIRATTSMAEALGLRVVVEGVETEAQAAALRGLGCHAAQGYLFARPMEPSALTAWLAERQAMESGKVVRLGRSTGR